MFGALVLFESEFVHVVAISFTALVLTELLMVALTIRTWHWLMVVAQLLSLGCYVASLAFLNEYFGKLPCICLLNNCLFLVFTRFSCCFCDMIFSADCRPLHSAQLTLQGDGVPCSDAQSWAGLPTGVLSLVLFLLEVLRLQGRGSKCGDRAPTPYPLCVHEGQDAEDRTRRRGQRTGQDAGQRTEGRTRGRGQRTGQDAGQRAGRSGQNLKLRMELQAELWFPGNRCWLILSALC